MNQAAFRPSRRPRRGHLHKRRPWTAKEDEAIRALVLKLGTKQWTLVATQLLAEYGVANRTGKQCRERWHNHLETGISKDPWSCQEERALFDTHSKVGNKWAEIAKQLPGRTDNSIKNHFYSTLRKHFRRIYGVEPNKDQLRKQTHGLATEILEGFSCTQTQIDDILPGELCVWGHQIELPTQWAADECFPELCIPPQSPVGN